MRIAKRQPLLDFAEKHPTLRRAIASLLASISEADWQVPADVVQSFGESRIVQSDPNDPNWKDPFGKDSLGDTFTKGRVCIDIGGRKCRVVIKVRYSWGIVYFRWIGLHKDYDKLLKEGKRIEDL